LKINHLATLLEWKRPHGAARGKLTQVSTGKASQLNRFILENEKN
jgi:hypothetical protein